MLVTLQAECVCGAAQEDRCTLGCFSVCTLTGVSHVVLGPRLECRGIGCCQSDLCSIYVLSYSSAFALIRENKYYTFLLVGKCFFLRIECRSQDFFNFVAKTFCSFAKEIERFVR